MVAATQSNTPGKMKTTKKTGRTTKKTSKRIEGVWQPTCTQPISSSSPRAPRKVKISTDFSGMEAPVMGVKKQDPDVYFEHVFSSDSAVPCKKLIQGKFKPKRFYRNVKTRKQKHSLYSDLYMWGAPCVSFSSLGDGDGIDSPSGSLISCAMSYIKWQRPRATLMENVANLAKHKKHRRVLKGIIKCLCGFGYKVWVKILNSKDFQVPQDRSRVYLVAILGGSLQHDFKWPDIVAPPVTLQQILDSDTRDFAGRLPKGHRPKQLVKDAYKTVTQQGINPLSVPMAIDIGCAEKFKVFGVSEAKTLTTSRASVGGPWVSTKGRRTTLDEMFKIQGFNPRDYDGWAELGVT